jgi:hypothetical protein
MHKPLVYHPFLAKSLVSLASIEDGLGIRAKTMAAKAL